VCSTASETIRPRQITLNTSSLLTTRSRIADQELQKVEYLRFERTRHAAATQFAPIGIQGAVTNRQITWGGRSE
jgi:hypothetical protein